MSRQPDNDPTRRRAMPPGTFRLGTIAGIDVTVASSWFLVVGLIAILFAPRIREVTPGIGGWAYVAAAAFAVLLYGSVLLHEISHALAARAFQMPVRSINLHFLGGATEIEAEATTPWREFVIAVVGPLTSVSLGVVCYLGYDAFDAGLVQLAVGALAVANLVVGVINLVPGLPLDGGRVLQAAVWGVSGRRSTGVVAAGWVGRAAAVLALSYPLILLATGSSPDIVDYLMAFLIGGFMWAGATEALAMSKLRSKLPALQARRLGRRAVGIAADLPLAEAVRRAQEVQAGSLVVVSTDGRPTGIVSEAAVESTPEERRPWMTAGDLARRIEDGLMLPADLAGEDLLRAMNRTPASEYVLVEPSGAIYGVLVTKDVDHAFRTA